MNRAGRAVEIFVGLGGVAVVSLVAIAIYVGSSSGADGNPAPWFLVAGMTAGLVVAIPTWYFGLHPWFVWMEAQRSRRLTEAQAGQDLVQQRDRVLRAVPRSGPVPTANDPLHFEKLRSTLATELGDARAEHQLNLEKRPEIDYAARGYEGREARARRRRARVDARAS